MNEVDAQAIELCPELRPAGEFGFAIAPVIAATPIINEGPHRAQRRALFPTSASLMFGPACLIETASQVRQGSVRGPVLERMILPVAPMLCAAQTVHDGGASADAAPAIKNLRRLVPI